MKILILGDAESIHNRNLMKYVLTGHEIVLHGQSFDKYADFYKQSKVTLVQAPVRGQIRLVSGLLYCFQSYKLLRKSNYDLIITSFVSTDRIIMNFLLRNCSRYRLAVFWGSDILRITKREFICKKHLLKYYDKFVIPSLQMRKKFEELFGCQYNHRIYGAKFGLSELDFIEKIKEIPNSAAKEKMSLPSDKVIVSIGYNRAPEQQHLRVLEQIGRLEEEKRKRIHVVLRLTYGENNKSYICKLEEKLRETGCGYSFFTKFLDDEKNAWLTKATDLFIHAQITDSLSATILEHLLAGGLVFNPCWIPYPELTENGVFYIEYKTFDELPGLLHDCVELKEQSRFLNELQKNQKRIYQLFSWNAIRMKWKQVMNFDEPD